MKTKYSVVLICLVFAFFGCTNDEENNNDPINGAWNLKNISGGFVGIDNDFNDGVIVWTFNQLNGVLVIQNDNDSSAIYDGLASGTYTFRILEKEEKEYLIIDNRELGGMILRQNELIIDQNDMSTGSGADRFVLKLQK